MTRTILLAVMICSMSLAEVQAKNYAYGTTGMSMENEGYKIFVSDKIADTVDRFSKPDKKFCDSTDENTSKNLGDVNQIRTDERFSVKADTKISYSTACCTFYSVIDRLKTTDDVRKLWLLFADSATDNYASDTLKEKGKNEDSSILIEMKRLTVVSKYIEFFTKNKEWKLTEYTFLSQAFKTRKGKTLSPAFSQFVAALVTGDTEKAVQVVASIDLDNLGERFSTK